MLINKLGEFGVIDLIKKSIKTDNSVVCGVGDDCAVLKYNSTHFQLASCDMIVEGVDFKGNTNPYMIGRKALAVSISDIAACGGIPKHALVSLGLPKKTKIEKVKRIIAGISDLAKEYKINIVGGDISSSKELVLDVNILGLVEKNKLVLRSKAKIGDLIFVSGAIGGSIKGKHLSFIPRIKESRFLVNNFKINAMIDVSDGLVQDLSHILKQSNVGAVIFESSVPINSFCSSFDEAISAGEDFELLFTAPMSNVRKIMENKYFPFFAIGEICSKENGLKLITKDLQIRNLEIKGFRHF